MKNPILILCLILFVLPGFSQPSEPLIDVRDGQSYKTVILGTQTWMAENLNYETPNSWCYDDSTSNCSIYGRLYTWKAAKNSCPDNWHLPSNEEWRILEKYLGISPEEINVFLYHGEKEGIGTKLKSKTGFNALLGGRKNYTNVGFEKRGEIGVWWTSTLEIFKDVTYAYRREIFSDKSGIDWDEATMTLGFSVRCVKNEK